MKNNTKVTLTIGQIKKLVREAKATHDDPDSVIDGTAAVKSMIAEMKAVGEDIEKIQEMEGLLKSITADSIERAKAARDARTSAHRAVAQEYTPLGDAAKRLADAIEAQGDVFFSVRKNTKRIGLLLTKKEDDISYGRIVKLLMDPEFVAKHKKAKKIGSQLRKIIEEATEVLKECGAIEPTWQTDIYSRNAKGEMQRLREGFIGRMFGKVKDAITMLIKKIFPSCENKVNEFGMELEGYADMLEDATAQAVTEASRPPVYGELDDAIASLKKAKALVSNTGRPAQFINSAIYNTARAIASMHEIFDDDNNEKLY